MLTIDATTPGYFGRETATLRAHKTTRRVNNSDLLVKESNYSSLLYTAAVVSPLMALAYGAYVVLSVGCSIVG